MRVAELWIHPVKSFGAIAVEQIDVDDVGPRFDRRWLVVDEAGVFRTQRDLPTMALVRTAIDGDALVMSAVGFGQMRVPLEPGEVGESREVRVWNDTVRAVEPSPEASAWVARALGLPSTLVALPPSTVRAIEAKYADGVRPGARVGFADGFPFLVASRASLAALEGHAGTRLLMRRFRPNVVIEGLPAWDEDRVRVLRAGSVTLHLVKPCARCSVTTVDPDTAARGAEPLRTLGEIRRDPLQPNKVNFGVNAIHEGPGAIRVGDPVAVVR